MNLQARLEKELNLIPAQALVLVNELARYEAEYTYKKIVKNTPKALKENVKKLDESRIELIVNSTLINTSIQAPKRTIGTAYRQFAENKARQYMQIVNDSQVVGWDDKETERRIKDRTSGLFTTQNLALAGLAILASASSIRSEVAKENLMMVDWVLDLELNNCPYCEDMANGGPYEPDEVLDQIPLHANCGCALVPILGDGNEA